MKILVYMCMYCSLVVDRLRYKMLSYEGRAWLEAICTVIHVASVLRYNAAVIVALYR